MFVEMFFEKVYYFSEYDCPEKDEKNKWRKNYEKFEGRPVGLFPHYSLIQIEAIIEESERVPEDMSEEHGPHLT